MLLQPRGPRKPVIGLSIGNLQSRFLIEAFKSASVTFGYPNCIVRQCCVSHGGRRWTSTSLRLSTASIPHPRTVPYSTSSVSQYEHISLPSTSVRNDPSEWIKFLEPALPAHLQVEPVTHVPILSSQPVSPSSIAYILAEARRQYQIDILARLGLEEKRWPACVWLAKILIDNSITPIKPNSLKKTLSAIGKNGSEILDETTRSAIRLDFDAAVDYASRSLEEISSPGPQTTWTLSRHAMGSLWHTLGTLILSASNEPEAEESIMFSVLQIISYLQQRGQVSEKIYDSDLNVDPSAFRRSVRLSKISPHDLSSISLAEVRSNMYQPPQRLLHAVQNPQVFALEPEIWFEFVIWNCIDGGWLLEAAACLREMMELQGSCRWIVKRCSNMKGTNAVRPDKDLKLHTLMDCSNTEAKDNINSVYNNRSHHYTHTISAEVVIALIDGFITNLDPDSANKLITPQIALEGIKILRNILSRDSISLEETSWDVFITRLAEGSGLTVENNPGFMASVLSMATHYGQDGRTRKSPISINGSQNLASYIDDGTATIIGLYHRVLHAHVRAGNLGGALQDFANLQSLTDVNKKRSLDEFFRDMKVTEIDESVGEAADGQHFNPEPNGAFKSPFHQIEYPGFFPRIPNNVLADFLDLITESKAYDIGQWMITSNDIDGPTIPEALHSDSVLAPALIRFATSARDKNLLSKLVKAQSGDVPGMTMLALCNTRIRFNDFEGASEVLNFMRDFSMHAWTTSDVARLVAALLTHLTPSSNTSMAASTLLQRLLRGDIRQLMEPNFVQLDSLILVLSSISSSLSALCSPLLSKGKHYMVDLHTETFNIVLDGAVRTYGSSCGQFLWETWCGEDFSRHNVGTFQERSGELSWAHTIRNASSSKYLNADGTTNAAHPATFSGQIIPNLATIRIIVRSALTEHRRRLQRPSEAVEDGEVDKHSLAQKNKVLDWAVHAFTDFGLGSGDIDYELQGYRSNHTALPHSGPLYGAQTFRIWQAFTGSRKAWALAREATLRSFAENSAEKHLLFEPLPAAERYLIHCLSGDFGLMSESIGDDDERRVKIFKTDKSPKVPARRVDEALRRYRVLNIDIQ